MGGEMRRYSGIDLGKFIMAIIVVAMHTLPLKDCSIDWLNKLYGGLDDMAVPFFFIAAGFLLASKMEWPYTNENSLEILKSYIIRMIKLYVLWNIIYFPLALIPFVMGEDSVIRCALIYIRGFFFVGENYNSWILWYLLSSIYGLMLLYFLLSKKVSYLRILIISGGIFIVSFSFDWLVDNMDCLPSLLSLGAKIIQYAIASGRILRGAYFLPLGFYLAHKELNKVMSIVLMIVGYVMNTVSIGGFINYLGIVVCSVGMFTVFKNLKLPEASCFSVMRKMSTIIYFSHMYVWTIYYGIRYGEKTFGFDCFVYTVAISLAISALYITINRKAQNYLRRK